MGWLLLDEKLPIITIIGAGLIMLGGFLINFDPKNRKTHIKKKLNPLPED
jgi:drug/metabolite transporter (DMT)-like permease